MRKSQPGGTALLITVSPEPGKYTWWHFSPVFFPLRQWSLSVKANFSFFFSFYFFRNTVISFSSIFFTYPINNKNNICCFSYFSFVLLHASCSLSMLYPQYYNERIDVVTFHDKTWPRKEHHFLRLRKRPHMDVVQDHGNPRVLASKPIHEPSLSKISLIFWTCCAGRIRY